MAGNTENTYYNNDKYSGGKSDRYGKYDKYGDDKYGDNKDNSYNKTSSYQGFKDRKPYQKRYIYYYLIDKFLLAMNMKTVQDITKKSSIHKTNTKKKNIILRKLNLLKNLVLRIQIRSTK